MPRSASLRDHVRPRNPPYLQNEVIEERLQRLLSPVVYSQLGLYRQMGHRTRILTLPLMMA
ncbi:MAG: IS4 family transposase, partial [Cyanobacteria bacterium P01_D01_bin.6]